MLVLFRVCLKSEFCFSFVDGRDVIKLNEVWFKELFSSYLIIEIDFSFFVCLMEIFVFLFNFTIWSMGKYLEK